MLHRYSRLGYVALNVADIERSKRFYEELWGLQANGEGTDGSTFLRCSDDHHNVVLYQGKPGLKRLGWQLESEYEVQTLAENLHRHGLTTREIDAAEQDTLRQGRTLRFTDPFTGVVHEYYARMCKAEHRWRPTVAQIQRVGHVVLKTPRYAEAIKFYVEVLNFRISDAIGDRVTFMRCFPNPLHHSLGLSNADGPALHHVNFMVSEIDDIGKALWRFNKSGIPIVRGPGRHPPSGSVFLYVLDPDGLTVEYSYGMEEFPENGARAHRVLPNLPESIDVWGAPTDKRMGAVGEIDNSCS